MKDTLAITRKKRLLMMSRCSILGACVSLLTIVVGLLAIMYSDSVSPYSMGGGVVAGEMVYIYVHEFSHLYKK